MPPVIPETSQTKSSVYGPVTSWRVGQSLGVDLLLHTSTCSFNCIYCQLGHIQQKTIERKIYVETDQVERDFKNSDWQQADIVTLSGSGEPTLALNLAEVIHFIQEYSHKPVMVLTNGTTLQDPAVRQDLMAADVVAVKLDAPNDDILQRMNRPVAGVTLESIVDGATQFRQEYKGKLCLQCMFMPANLSQAEAIARMAQLIQPDEIQLNTPKRPYPLQWVLESRGNHGEVDYPTQTLRVVSEEEAGQLKRVFEQLTDCPIVSVYRSDS